MKFGFKQLGAPTPQALANLGHGLLGFSITVSAASVVGGFPKLSIAISLIGGIGNLLINMFGNGDKNNVNPLHHQ